MKLRIKINDGKVACKLCNLRYYRVTNTHLWREHRISCEEYLAQFPGARLETASRQRSRGDKSRGKTYEQQYGTESALALRAKRQAGAHLQFQDPAQRDLRRLTSKGPSPVAALKISISRTEHGGFNYRKRALRHYGERCELCGSPENLHVHHRDHRHAEGAGNHAIENLQVLCKTCHAKDHGSAEGKFRGLGRFEKGIIYVLEGMRRDFGIDVHDQNFLDTPMRFARALNEILSGAHDTAGQVGRILATGFNSGGFDDILVATGIQAVSLCPHHLLPVRYSIDVAYLPSGGKVLGLSKLVRLAEVLAARPVLQETMTSDIAKALMDGVGASGAGVVVRGEHACMWARGVKQDTTVQTSSMLGAFREDAAIRAEVFNLFSLGRKRDS